MKILTILTFLYTLTLSSIGYSKNMTLYDFSFIDIDNNIVQLNKFSGKPILMVNTASRCGFTLAITSNSFNQEYASNEDIKKICLVNYDVGFVTSSPMSVKGEDSHEIFSWLQNDYGKTPKWNFYKYLFDREGNLVSSWSSMTKPDSSKIIKEINKLL